MAILDLKGLDQAPDRVPDLPVGVHTFEVQDITVEPNKAQDGTNMVVKAKLTSGPEETKGMVATQYFSMKQTIYADVGRRRFFLSLGVNLDSPEIKQHGLDSSQLVGRQFRAVVEANTYVDKTGKTVQNTQIKTILIPGEAGYDG